MVRGDGVWAAGLVEVSEELDLWTWGLTPVAMVELLMQGFCGLRWHLGGHVLVGVLRCPWVLEVFQFDCVVLWV